MASRPPQSPRAPSLILPTFLTLLLLVTQPTPGHAQEKPVASIVFTRYTNAPVGWTKYSIENTTATAVQFSRITSVFPEFRFVLRADALTYTFLAPSSGYHTLRLGLYEHQLCTVGRRVARYTVNGVSTPNIDITAAVGCKQYHFVDLSFFVNTDRRVTLTFAKLKNKWSPIISNIRLFEGRVLPEGVTPEPIPDDPTPSPSPRPRPDVIDEVINFGPDTNIPGTTALEYKNAALPLDTIAAEELGIASSVFYTAVQGMSFEVKFDLPPGLYDVTLGFVETQRTSCPTGSRIFNVLVNGDLRLEAFDIVAAARACRRATVANLTQQAVDSLNPQPLTISFQAIAGNALVSYIRVKAAETGCKPLVAGEEVTADHLSHAVPGTYPPSGESSYIDTLSKGFVNVFIDGLQSHTHFSADNKPGRITSYLWVIPDTGKVLATTATFTGKFLLGTTRIRLTVTDNACSKDEAETSVTVTGNILPGAYCYYYDGLRKLPSPGRLTKPPLPVFSQEAPNARFGFANPPFEGEAFIARCLFFLEFDSESTGTEFSIDVKGTGDARVYKGRDLIIDSETSLKSVPTKTSVGLAAYEVIYMRTDMVRTPTLTFMVNGSVPSNVLYDRSTVLPIVTDIDPPFSGLEGGGKTTIRGYGLFIPLQVRFGSKRVMATAEGSTPTAAIVFPPAVSEVQTVDVSVQSPTGLKSGSLKYEYGSTCDPIQFKSTELRHDDGRALKFNLPTSVAMWQDGRMYVGTRGGVLHAVTYDAETLKVSNVCQSERLTDPRYLDGSGKRADRSIMGITFHPADTVGRPYISLSCMFWERNSQIADDNTRAWSNGAVERLKPTGRTTGQCLEYDTNIVRYLPVSDGDHSVNEMVFTQHGDLIISVGSNTNAGLPYVNLGGNWEAYFSGAFVIAHLSRGAGFNGEISYTTPDNLRTARPQSDDVELYATGVRNPFSLHMTRKGRLYSADMGANCRFGNVSSSCDQYNEEEAKVRSVTEENSIPGYAVVGPQGECRYSTDRPDKLIEVKPGKFYGHSNLQRGAMINAPHECVWIDPNTDLSPPPASKPPPGNYEPRLASLKSPMTGIREYGASVFCEKMRGDLIMSVYQGIRTYRVPTDGAGSVSGEAAALHPESALRVEESVLGDLIFPGYNEDIATLVLRPKLRSRSGFGAVNALPVRHGRAGGTLLIVGGWGFGEAGVTVKVGGLNCAVVRSAKNQVTCRMPAYNGGSESKNVVVSQGTQKSELKGAVLYMSV